MYIKSVIKEEISSYTKDAFNNFYHLKIICMQVQTGITTSLLKLET